MENTIAALHVKNNGKIINENKLNESGESGTIINNVHVLTNIKNVSTPQTVVNCEAVFQRAM